MIVCLFTDVDILSDQLLFPSVDDQKFLDFLLVLTLSFGVTDEHLVLIIALFGVFVALLRAEHTCTLYK